MLFEIFVTQRKVTWTLVERIAIALKHRAYITCEWSKWFCNCAHFILKCAFTLINNIIFQCTSSKLIVHNTFEYEYPIPPPQCFEIFACFEAHMISDLVNRRYSVLYVHIISSILVEAFKYGKISFI